MTPGVVAVLAGGSLVAVVLLLAVPARPRRARPHPTRDTALVEYGSGRRPRRRVVVGSLAVVAAVTTMVAGAIVALCAGAITACAVVSRRRSAQQRRRREIEGAMPDAVELLVLCVHAGWSPHQAIAELAIRAPPAVREAFADVERHVHRGRSLADALGSLGERLGPAGAEVAAAVAGADRDGLPLAPVLDRLAIEARTARRRVGDAEARRLPVRLTFPLVCCTLPSFVLLTIAPALLGALSTLRSDAP